MRRFWKIAGLTVLGGVVISGVVAQHAFRQYPSVEYGARTAAKTGVLANYPLINCKVTLLDGSYHPVDSSQIAFELAGQIAFKEACRNAVTMGEAISSGTLPRGR